MDLNNMHYNYDSIPEHLRKPFQSAGGYSWKMVYISKENGFYDTIWDLGDTTIALELSEKHIQYPSLNINKIFNVENWDVTKDSMHISLDTSNYEWTIHNT